ncbi:MAG: class I SAM-dependent methyltransferase, partial [Pseudobutyrivibrio sp.]|nr:class I SAM-dependent methyltransferase [Pseudobutyrivibrio sp.]
TAVELVKHNLGMLKAKGTGVKAYQGNALKLKRFDNDSFDLTLLFGPMYHLKSREEQLQALKEAKRVTKPGGYILVAYVMNEYAFLTYGIKEGHILENIAEGKLDEAYHVRPGADDLYAFMRTEDIASLNEDAGVKRIQIISPDGPANHMRQEVNALTEEQFAKFIEYQMSVCEREDLLGASAHTVDILRK